MSDADRSILRRIADTHRELGDLYDALASDESARRRPRKPAARQPPKFALVPNDLQREKAAGVLRAKGLAR